MLELLDLDKEYKSKKNTWLRGLEFYLCGRNALSQKK
jgi:hypothetical protein